MRRLTFSLLLVVVIAVIGLGWAIDQWYGAQHSSQEDQTLKTYRHFGPQLISLINITHADEKILSTWAQQSNIQLMPYVDFPIPENFKHSFELGEPLLLNSNTGISLHYYLPQQKMVASFQFSVDNSDNNDSSLRWLLTLIFYSGIICIVFIWLYPLLKRLTLLRTSARAFGAGNLSKRIPLSAVSYIADIEQEFNRMAQKIEHLIADNKLLSRGLSHDLRTPLARLRFGLDVLEEESLSDKQHKTLAHLNRDLLAMESLVEILLRYARLEQANISFKPEAIQLQKFLLDLVQKFYPDNVNVLTKIMHTESIIYADPEYLSMLLNNVLQNAQRHGNGEIDASVVRNEGKIILIVEDNGSGIPLAEQQHVLKPFYRAKSVQNTQGHGMGLAIVDKIAQWHKADVNFAKSEKLGGLKISIHFPNFSD